jgi:SAM-dependent methyltransferase
MPPLKIPLIGRVILWQGQSRKKHKFEEDIRCFRELSAMRDIRFMISDEDRYPCLNDATAITEFDRHYVYHTAWAARVLAETHPDLHVDIGSYLYFATLVSAFVPIRFFDYRPAQVELPGLETGFADLLALPFEDGSVSSLSCMHVVEHVGLGRYGDPLDPEGDLKAMRELARVLASGGDLLFVVPVGQPRVMFNAHRIYSYEQVVDAFPNLVLEKFVLIPQSGPDGLVTGSSPERVAEESYGCGCFWFRRSQEGLKT